jgi:UDPglucose 6-dehydrogenase
MKIAVVGTGYVGLVTGTCFAETGNSVTCIDIDENKVKKLQNGEVTIYEPGLDALFERNISENRLKFTTSLAKGISGADVIFLALPTPPSEDGSADLKYILNVASDLGKLINKYVIIVDKSTVPVGTSEKVTDKIAEYTDVDFDVVSNPEFLREGAAIEDFMKPERVVIGTSSNKARKIMETLYEPFVRSGNPIIFMDEKSAELTKYAANSFLAMKISYMNEIANLCEKVGANVNDVRKGIGTDSRIGKRFLFPGIGWGGSCFPKDVLALKTTAKQYGYEFKLLNSTIHVNTLQKRRLYDKVLQKYGFEKESLKDKTIALWGLSFKPETDDIREAPALEIIDNLLRKNATIVVYDPEAMENVKQMYGDKLIYAKNQYDALKNADLLMINTEWNEFRTPDFNKMKSLLKEPVIFDGRNLYSLDAMDNLNFKYYSIGRADIE